MNSIKYLKSGLLWLLICTFMAFLIKSSNAQNTTAQNQPKLIEKNPNSGVCKGKATEKLLKSELDRILDKKKYDIRFRMKISTVHFRRPSSLCQSVPSTLGDQSLSVSLDRPYSGLVPFYRFETFNFIEDRPVLGIYF